MQNPTLIETLRANAAHAKEQFEALLAAHVMLAVASALEEIKAVLIKVSEQGLNNHIVYLKLNTDDFDRVNLFTLDRREGTRENYADQIVSHLKQEGFRVECLARLEQRFKISW